MPTTCSHSWGKEHGHGNMDICDLQRPTTNFKLSSQIHRSFTRRFAVAWTLYCSETASYVLKEVSSSGKHDIMFDISEETGRKKTRKFLPDFVQVRSVMIKSMFDGLSWSL